VFRKKEPMVANHPESVSELGNEFARCPADHEILKSLAVEEWHAQTAALVARGGPDYPGTESRNCACGSTLTRVHDQAALDAFIENVAVRVA
jgi:hypothetical protein